MGMDFEYATQLCLHILHCGYSPHRQIIFWLVGEMPCRLSFFSLLRTLKRLQGDYANATWMRSSRDKGASRICK